jgi:hypothetical protein
MQAVLENNGRVDHVPQVWQDHQAPFVASVALVALEPPQSSDLSHRYHGRRCIRRHCLVTEGLHLQDVDLQCHTIQLARGRLLNLLS